jgi:Mg-chelatase subunit ChlI
MERSDKRAADEHGSSEHASAQPEPEPTAHWQVFERNRRNVRRQQEQPCELAATVAATQEQLTATLGALAERAVREGRADDARRSASEAHAALRGAGSPPRPAG